MNELVALDRPGGIGFVGALEQIWDAGDAAFPVDQRLPPSGKLRLFERFGVGAVLDESGGSTRLEFGRPTADGDALVMATSGSSGEPKGAVLTHDAIEASAVATSHRLGVTPDDTWLACLPLSHVGGLAVVTRAIHTGTRIEVLPHFDASVVGRSDATLVSLVPTTMRRIDASRFRVIVLGGSAPPSDRPDNTVTTYGMTETGSGVVYDRRPLDGVELRIADHEVHVRCPMLLRCYRDGRDPKTADGWLPTGDLGSIDDQGLLSVQGRRGDLIITGGENVWPEPIEAILRTHPDVADVAVVGIDDAEWGQVVTAHVVPRDQSSPVTLDALRALVADELPAFHAPRRLVLTSAIPRTSLGKPKRGALARNSG